MDVDYAQFYLGRAIGLFADRSFLQAKSVFWTENPLGDALYQMLRALVMAGVLECRDEPELQFRWKPGGP
ncbi:hypothetical protein [Micromonospora sp. MP36]|uniref:hypothetical protein n=1 Tax=Micromonospora sp. MP36 TaxID=2604468 RepID=UPI0011DBB5FC|nr:hypothetical protein [Micromonospora sp. MP36]TYC24310.1 hypothetical protein FXF52_11200 [Micromonospora sp. MP36]